MISGVVGTYLNLLLPHYDEIVRAGRDKASFVAATSSIIISVRCIHFA